MKKNEYRSGRMGHRTLGVVITVLVVVAVIILNLVISALGQANIWQVDLTIDNYLKEEKSGDFYSLYTLTRPFEELIEKDVLSTVDDINSERTTAGEAPLTVNIIFCSDRDTVWESDTMRYVLYTALQLEKTYPEHFKVSFVNIQKDPSAVQMYKATSSTHIYTSNVIFEFGTEYRVYPLREFFLVNSGESTAWAYNGEKHFANALLAITRAVSPVACFLTNHGERVDECEEFRYLVERSGYIVRDLDLSKDDIPENCRMLICYDPQTDFYDFGAVNEEDKVSEIEKLDKYLDGSFSFMLFVDNQTPTLPNLEGYLKEWGFAISRGADKDGHLQNYTIRDTVQKLDKDGYTLISDYAQGGLGANITADMRKVAYPAKVIFSNATAISMADGYHYTYVEANDSSGSPAYRMGRYFHNGITRYLNDVFVGGENAIAEVGGQQYEISTASEKFKLMAVTSEDRIMNEINYDYSVDRSFVCVFGSTDFASDEVLSSSAYGNADVLAASLRVMGRETTPALLDLRAFKVYDIEEKDFLTSSPLPLCICLMVIPAAICFGVGICVTMKRKYK